MGRTIGTVLTLKDLFSPALLKAMNTAKKFGEESKKATAVLSKSNWHRETRQAFNLVEKGVEGLNKKLSSGLKFIGKYGSMVAGAITGLSLKTGFEEAFNMEGYRTQLETATKDTQKASELMKEAVGFANSTPFQTGEVVEATAKMEMYGLSSRRWLKDVADMAGSTNKSIDQATEAMADIAVGEFERIKEFGIKKDQILLESNKRYGEGAVINAKGQVVDQAKLMDTVQAMMQEKFKGGAERLANTTKGLWSTIQGISKTSMAGILGAQADGTIKAGSLLDKIKEKAKGLADTLQKWQSDGTLDSIAKKFTEGFTKVLDTVTGVFNFIKDNKGIIIYITEVVVGFVVVIEVILKVIKIVEALQAAWAAINLLFLETPIGWIVIGIFLIVAAGVALYKNWAMIKQKATDLWNYLKATWENLSTTWKVVVIAIVSVLTGGIGLIIALGIYLFSHINEIKAKAREIGEGISNFFTWIGNTISNWFTWIINGVSNFFSWIGNGISNFVTWLGSCIATGFMAVVNVIKIIITPIARIFEAIFKLTLAVVIIVCVRIKNVFMTVWNAIYNFLAPIMSAIGSFIISVWNAIVSTITSVLSAIWNVISSVWNAIWETISGVLSSIWSTITSIWDSIYGTISSVLSSIWDTCVSIWDGIWSSISSIVDTIWNGIVNGFTRAKDGVISVWQGVKSTIVGIFEGIWDGIKGILNKGIDMVNDFIGGVNNVISVANGLTGIGISEVPPLDHFAKGTQYTFGGLAVVNEKGGELRQLSSGETIVPADKSKQLMDNYSKKGGGTNIYITVMGNMIGNEEYMEQTGDYIVDKIKTELGNI